MSLKRQVKLQCDQCHTEFAGWHDDPRKLRRIAKRAGWLRYVRNGGKHEDNVDICPQCLPTWQPPDKWCIGRQVAYFPPGVEMFDYNHPDTQYGFVTGVGESGENIFCRFWAKKYDYLGLNLLRTRANSELVPVSRVTTYTSRPRKIIERTLNQIHRGVV